MTNDNKEVIIQQYLNSQIDLRDIKAVNEQDVLPDVKTLSLENDSAKEYEKLKNKINKFREAKTFDEVKEIAKNVFNMKDEINYYKAGDANCVIVNRGNTIKVIFDSKKEQIFYNFSKKQNQ